MVEIYKGKDIDDNKIKFLKYITLQRYCDEIYNHFYSNINNVEDLARLHGMLVDFECLAIGTDWFLCYSEFENCVFIHEWASKDNANKLKQAVEMLELFKKIFIKNKNKWYNTFMRHDTSYKIYSKMFQRGYFKEIKNRCSIDFVAPPEVQEFMKEFNSIEDFLLSDIANNYSKYFQYILHHIVFKVSPMFIEKFDENENEVQKRVLKK